PSTTRFPYTTLFRSVGHREQPHRLARERLVTAHAVALLPVGPRKSYPPRADPVMPGEQAPLRGDVGEHAPGLMADHVRRLVDEGSEGFDVEDRKSVV